ncbi:hypothetical protein [Paenibacillus sp. MBLB4367]|uniref:hypothetical protein n=1 Tax=Paenibacillus sp. MBLB4367 TaxID=3384767 RepID=UPI003908199D
MVFAILLIGGMMLFFGIVCWLVAIMVRTDTIEYDMTFLWNRYGINRKMIEYR